MKAYKLQRALLVGLLALMFPVGAGAFTVVIDAGHGGKDPGALGAVTREKDLALAVAKQVGSMLQGSASDLKVYLTRTTDVFLTLQERADFVNKHNADLFICIHANAAENKKLYGSETYVLGLHKMESNLQVAMRENAVMMLEDDYKTAYQGFDPNSVESYIMFEFMQDRFLDNSLQFASYVQQEFSSSLGRTDRGVRQAGFWVLHKSACPSVLVEMGFISNPEEEKYMASERGKREISEAICRAFRTYKAGLDQKSASVATIVQTEPQSSPAPAPAQTEAVDKPVYKVQIFSVKSPLKAGDPSFCGLKGCDYTRDGAYCKYTYGNDTDYEKVLELKNSLQKQFKDCFVVAFLNGKQIPVKEALKITNQ